MHEWYIHNAASKQDVNRSAEKAAGRTRQPQFIHHHAPGEDCNSSCRIEPAGSHETWPPGQSVHHDEPVERR